MRDPNWLFETVTAILKALFEREEAQLAKRELSILDRNAGLTGKTDGFRHLGIIYTQLTGAARPRGDYGRLHSSLAPEMDSIVEDRKLINFERDRIRQALAMVLDGCENLQDMRDALPNALKDFCAGLGQLERTRPEAFTLAENPRSYTQYMKLREKIEFYVATRLLY
jgi:hypothetical protein